jgi:hypothetical protein
VAGKSASTPANVRLAGPDPAVRAATAQPPLTAQTNVSFLNYAAGGSKTK